MLLEVLIAFVIAALALGVLYDTVLTALQSAQTSALYEQAVARARSRLAIAVHAEPLQAGEWRGDDGEGFVWRLRVTALDTIPVRATGALTLASSASFQLTLYSVTSWIGWHHGSRLHWVKLSTEQIGQAAR